MRRGTGAWSYPTAHEDKGAINGRALLIGLCGLWRGKALAYLFGGISLW